MESSQIPRISFQCVENVIETLYSLKVFGCKLLTGYEDLNFWLYSVKQIIKPKLQNEFPDYSNKMGYILKVTNERDSAIDGLMDAQIKLLSHLKLNNLPCPEPIMDSNRNICSLQTIEYKNLNETEIKPHKHVVALLKYIPGQMMSEIPIKADHMLQLGELLGRFHLASSTFKHEFYNRTIKPKWSLHSVHMVKHYVNILPDNKKKCQVEFVLDQFEMKMEQLYDKSLPEGIIHGDFNTCNILVNEKSENHELTGFIDVGDSHQGFLIFDLAIAIAYILLEPTNISLEDAGKFVTMGYSKIRTLTEEEKHICVWSVCARLGQTLTYGYHTWTLNPTKENEYVLMTQKNGWITLDKLLSSNLHHIEEAWFRIN